MAIARREGHRFESSSPVGRYWLANCVGFTVTGGSSGRVAELETGVSDPHVPKTLVVRRRHHRPRRVPVSTVVAVDPDERTLEVEHVPGRAAVLSRRAVAGVRRSSVLLVQAAGLLALAGGRRAKRVLLVGAPRVAAGSELALAAVVTLSRRAVRESARLIRSVPWRRFGPSVRSGTTRAWRAISSSWSRLRTTSSRTRSESDSAAKARTTSST
jgi:hypothetical protein